MSQPSRTLNRINETDPFAMRYWARQLGVSEGDLRRAIDAVGNNPQTVRQYTMGHQQPRHGNIRRHGG